MTTANNNELPISLIWVGGLLGTVAVIYAMVLLLAEDGFGKNMARINSTDNPQIQERIRPVVSLEDLLGDESASDAAAPAVAAKSPQDMYNAACMACHAAGVAGAPKLGDKAGWEPRVALGIDALVSSVVNGKGAMPPKGGSAYSEDEIRTVVDYMLSESGFASSSSAQSAAAAAPAPEPAMAEPSAPMSADSADIATGGYDLAYGKSTYQSACFACHGTGAAGAPKLDDSAAWAPRLAGGIDALIASAINGKGVMPPRGGHMSLTDAQIGDIVAYMVDEIQ